MHSSYILKRDTNHCPYRGKVGKPQLFYTLSIWLMSQGLANSQPVIKYMLSSPKVSVLYLFPCEDIKRHMGDFGVDTAQDRGEVKPICTKRSSIGFADHRIHLRLIVTLRKKTTNQKKPQKPPSPTRNPQQTNSQSKINTTSPPLPQKYSFLCTFISRVCFLQLGRWEGICL